MSYSRIYLALYQQKLKASWGTHKCLFEQSRTKSRVQSAVKYLYLHTCAVTQNLLSMPVPVSRFSFPGQSLA